MGVKFDPDELVLVYDPECANRLSKTFVECAQIGMAMVAGDPSRFVEENESAGAVVVSGGELAGEGTWTAEHVRKLHRLSHEHHRDSVGIEWVKCPECGHLHYDGYGGVPCPIEGCNCARIYMPRGEGEG
jgi:hypothetical protein